MLLSADDEVLEAELHDACEQYKKERWADLSPDARRMACSIPQGIDLIRLLWEKQFYRSRLLDRLRKERDC